MKDINERIAELRGEHTPGQTLAEILRGEGYSLEAATEALKNAGYIVELDHMGDFTTMRLSGVPVKRGAAQYLKDHLNVPWLTVMWPKKDEAQDISIDPNPHSP
jgi:hypothetical protein